MSTPLVALHRFVSHRRQRQAFTLVELLVVIGIIALLVGILLPALNRARMAAKQVACLSQLRQIGNAMLLHAQDHVGYVQVADVASNFDATPAGLGDRSQKRYSYLTDTDGITPRGLPIAAALAPYLGTRIRTNSPANVLADQSNPDSVLRRIFSCPGELRPYQGTSLKTKITTPISYTYTSPLMYSSYAFNQAVLGFNHFGGTDPRQFDGLRGHLSAIKQPSRTMMLCDNFVWGADPSVPSYFRIYATYCPATLAEAYFGQNSAGPAQTDYHSWDQVRHRGIMNWLAADMHAEAAMLPAPNATFNQNGPLSDILIITRQ